MNQSDLERRIRTLEAKLLKVQDAAKGALNTAQIAHTKAVVATSAGQMAAGGVSTNAADISTVSTQVQQISSAAPRPSVQSSVAASRLFGTPYHNATGYPMTVQVTGTFTGAGFTLTAVSDSAASPTTIVAEQSAASGDQACLTFVVLAGDYYKVSNSQAGTITAWMESY